MRAEEGAGTVEAGARGRDISISPTRSNSRHTMDVVGPNVLPFGSNPDTLQLLRGS